jgi:ribonuclease Z
LESTTSAVIYEDEKVVVKTIPLKHRVYTNGFLFEEKIGDRKLNIDAVQQYEIETCYYQNIKNGKDIMLEDGRVIENQDLTFDPIPPKRYAFCSDTVYDERIVPNIKAVDILYHESTFLESEKLLAEKTMHSTAKEAAEIAKQAQVGQLILGHYSTRYESIEKFKEEAMTVFPNILLADDGVSFEF